MAMCAVNISLSQSAARRFPMLLNLFESIQGGKCCLEIVSALIGGPKTELVVAIKEKPKERNDVAASVIESPPDSVVIEDKTESNTLVDYEEHDQMKMYEPDPENRRSKDMDKIYLDVESNVNNTVEPASVTYSNETSRLKTPWLFSDQGTIASPCYEKDDKLITCREEHRHTFYHALHGLEEQNKSCPFMQSTKSCCESYDKIFASGLDSFLSGQTDNLPEGIEYVSYIVDHIKNYCECSPTCSKLWEYCCVNQIHSVLRYAKEGLVIFSNMGKGRVGKVYDEYIGYKTEDNKKDVVGRGGFGNVYKLTSKLVFKEELKHALIFSNPTVLRQVMKIGYDTRHHVIPLLEYVVGVPRADDPNKRVFLSVMPYMNRRGLHEQFRNTKNSCILDYMHEFPDQEKCIFNNYTTMFLHVFKGLQYLHSKGIVHGDIKDRNILVHQKCPCKSPIRCKCPRGEGVMYVLGDMGLFWNEGGDLSDSYMEWAKEKSDEPAGTTGMKATELYFMGMQGEKCGSSAADIWAGGVTMMKVLVGDNKLTEATEHYNEYLEAISLSSHKHAHKIGEADKMVQELQKYVKDLVSSQKYWEAEGKTICSKLSDIHKLLTSGKFLKQARWLSLYTYPDKLPLPFILGAVHVANSLHQHCLDRIPHVYTTPLWNAMKKVLGIITSSVRFLPKHRLDASEIISSLEALIADS